MVNNARFSPLIQLPEWPITQLLDLTSPSATWLVGGTVRDLLLNRPLHDWDFVTRENGILLAKKAANHFRGAFYVLDQSRETGRAVVFPPGASTPITLDFATIRAKELRGDLEMRDFTINSMAMSLSGKLIDPLNCAQDLIGKTIRMTTPGCFKQDPVRLLRAIRQAHLLHYPIENSTYESIIEQADLITDISPERILAELCAMLSSPLAAPAIQALNETQLLSHIFPELNEMTNPHLNTEQEISWSKVIKALKAIDLILGYIESKKPGNFIPVHFTEMESWDTFASELVSFIVPLQKYFNCTINSGINRSTILRWAVLLYPIPIEKIQHRLSALRMPKKSISTLFRHIQTCPLIAQYQPKITRKGIYQFYKQAGQDGPGSAILAIAFKLAESPDSDANISAPALAYNAGMLLRTYIEEEKDLISPIPLLSGDDLIGLGITPGPEMGLMLDRLLEAQVIGNVTSQDSAVAFIKDELSRID